MTKEDFIILAAVALVAYFLIRQKGAVKNDTTLVPQTTGTLSDSTVVTGGGGAEDYSGGCSDNGNL